MPDPAPGEGTAYNPTIKIEEKVTIEPTKDEADEPEQSDEDEKEPE